MQDSIEDFLKITKNSKTDDEPQISKEAQLTAQVKKECDSRAMKIVEFLIEGKLRPEIFMRCLPFITQSHYQDIVEERAITKLCGYPLCGKRIPEMPKKQYHISSKSNKVYDITDRKNYCSNFCYKASLHIKQQVDNSPLWLRKFHDIPHYDLLNSNDRGLPGEYIDQGIVKPAVMKQPFTSISTFTEASLIEAAENEIKPTNVKTKANSYKKLSKILKTTMQTITENAEQVEIEENEQNEAPKRINNKINTKIRNNKLVETKQMKLLPAIDENVEQEDVQPIKIKGQSKLDIESVLNKSFKEWLTLESYIFIYGEQRIRQILDEKKMNDYFETLHIPKLDRQQQIKYLSICKRLQLQEITDQKFDKAVIDGNTKLKPLPDYAKLKEETKCLNIKVKSFYGGVLYEKEENTSKEKEETQIVMPLVDNNSQNALRRKIFLNSVNKSMQHLLQSLQVNYFNAILMDLQGLVKTLRLKADNIIFKPVVWNYISLIFLNILSLKNESIQNLLKESRYKEYLEQVLNTIPNRINFINNFMTNFENIDLFIEDFITKKDCDN